jgi:hypothetical protein
MLFDALPPLRTLEIHRSAGSTVNTTLRFTGAELGLGGLAFGVGSDMKRARRTKLNVGFFGSLLDTLADFAISPPRPSV